MYVQDTKGCVATPATVTITQESNNCGVISPAFARSSTAPDFMATTFDAVLAPNPSTQLFKLNVSGAGMQPVFIRVVDLSGKIVYTTKGFASHTFNFGEALQPGMYMVEVRQGNEVKTLKAVKIR